MNGLSLLLYISLLAQAPAPLGSTAPLGSASTNGASGFNPNNSPLGPQPGALGNAAAALGSALGSALNSQNNGSFSEEPDAKSFGWQINKNGELEYLIQISPSSLAFMQSPTNRQELMSQIPPALIGRVKRVIVTIGDEILPRTSLEEIDRVIPAYASLQSSRVRDLESGAVQNVNNQSGNGFGDFQQPSATRANPATAPLGTSLSEQYRANPTPPSARNAQQAPLIDKFSSGRLSSPSLSTSNSVQNPNYNRLADNRGATTSMQPPLTDMQSRRNTDPPALGGPGYGPTYGNGNANVGSGILDRFGNPTTDRWGNPLSASTAALDQTGRPRIGSNQYPQSQYDPTYDSQYDRQQSYPGGTNGFGDTYARNSNPFYDPSRSSASYAGTGGLLPATGYLASTDTSTRASYPSTSYSQQDPNRSFIEAQRGLSGGRTDLTRTGTDSYRPAENNYFFYVFFILSIAVNIWMIHLLRTLYLRYRNLLSSLRSQATSLG